MLIFDIDPSSDPALARAVHALQQSAYKEEAGLIGDDRIPPLYESVDELRHQALKWIGAFAASAAGQAAPRDLVGAIAWELDHGRVIIDRLMVRSDCQRRGIATRLVTAVLARSGDCLVSVSTGKDNTPAHGLYARLGFQPTGNREVLPGLWVTDFERRPTT